MLNRFSVLIHTMWTHSCSGVGFEGSLCRQLSPNFCFHILLIKLCCTQVSTTIACVDELLMFPGMWVESRDSWFDRKRTNLRVITITYQSSPRTNFIPIIPSQLRQARFHFFFLKLTFYKTRVQRKWRHYLLQQSQIYWTNVWGINLSFWSLLWCTIQTQIIGNHSHLLEEFRCINLGYKKHMFNSKQPSALEKLFLKQDCQVQC